MSESDAVAVAGVNRSCTVVLLGTLDTKGTEYEYLRARIHESGCATVLVDAGVLGVPQTRADVDRAQVADAAGTQLDELVVAGDRGAAVEAMARGAAEVVVRLHSKGRLDAIVGLGGSGGSALVSHAMRALPIGVPKLLVSTVASGDTRPYIGESDIAMLHSVVDIAGLNTISERVLSNAAGAIAGMARSARVPRSVTSETPLVGATMFGVTTPCVAAARAILEQRGYEVLVFHATGTGGRSMEALMKAGFITGCLDVTTTELADELVGGVLSAGPDRLEMAGYLGIPQVVSLGALDMVNFGPIETVPPQFRSRNLYRHNPAVTLMRTTPDECEQLGRVIARKLNGSTGPVSVFIPLKGLSAVDVPGGPFHDPDADAALFRELKRGLRSSVEVVEMDVDINHPSFAQAMADRLDGHHRAWLSRQQVGARA